MDGGPGAATALVVVVGDVQAQMQPVLDAPMLAIVFQPRARIQFAPGQAGDQGDGLGLVFPEFAVDQRHLPREREADFFGRDFARLR